MAGDPRILLQNADKALASASRGLSFFGGREEKYSQAADLYVQAANAFRIQKSSSEAGQALEKAAEIQNTKLNEPADAANTMVDAFKVYRQDRPEDAVRCLEFSINTYCQSGSFRRAAQHQEKAGEVHELQLQNAQKALECYEAAAEWYNEDNASALANRLSLKVAEISALEGDYTKAIQNFENVATAAINNNLLRYSVKTYFLKAGLCHLATNDLVAAQRAIERYQDLDPSFSQTREHQLLVDLTSVMEAGDDAERFGDLVFQFDSVQKLDGWLTKILLRVKNQLVEKEEDFA